MTKKNESNINIKDIKDPSFLLNLSYKELEAISTEIREEIIDAVSLNGGHLSSNLGVVELTIALHRNFNFKKDKLLFDVGHQCYTHKILTGRDISNIRQKDGVAGFIKNKESEYDIFESGHSSTSLSASLAFAIDRDNKKEDYEVVSLIGDASIANGVAFEALNNIPSSKHKVIIVLNDNDMAISLPVGGLSNFFRKFQTSKSYRLFKKGYKHTFGLIKPMYKLGENFKNWIKRHLIATNVFDSLGFIYIGLVDGHDFKALDKAFKRAKKIKGPVVIHVRTIKGKGYSYAENDKTGYWHGVSPFNIDTGEPLSFNKDKISWSSLYSEFILERLKLDKNFYLICPGTLKGSELEKAAQLYPSRVIDTGISEEHAVILASNLAKLNYHVCVSIYSTFMQRAFDQISHDVARIHSNITFLVDRAGLVGNDGDTHQGIYDSSFLMGVPFINVAMASNANEAYQLFNNSFNSKESTFIRYPRSNLTKVNIDKKYKLKTYNILQSNSNNKVCVVSVGPLTNDLFKLLRGMKVDVINVVILKPIDKSLIKQLFKYKKIIIYSPYETSSGFVLSLTGEMTLNGFKGDILSRAVPLEFVEHMTVNEQLNKFNLLPEQVVSFVKKHL